MSSPLSPSPPRPKSALVLAGGAARGAYEVGVVDYLLRDVAKALGHAPRLDVLCGTSVGAINACVLAAYADDPVQRADVLLRHWRELSLDELLKPSALEIMTALRGFFGRRRPRVSRRQTRRGGLLDPRGIEHLVERAIPFERITEQLRRGNLSALTITCTHVASGKTVIFVQRAEEGLPRWSRDPTIVVRAAKLRADHALASAALPPLFPAVRIDGEFYCDGGLRQNVPLSPARRLGADGLIVVNPRYITHLPPPAVAQREEASYPGPLFLLGKALNALMLDRIDNDLDRLSRINRILEAGERRFGPQFTSEMNKELVSGEAAGGVRRLRLVHIRASHDIGTIAAEYVRSAEFASRAHGLVGRLLRRIGEWRGTGEADLLSYLLFDGGFAARLIELGRADARARHDELCQFFSEKTVSAL